jgi:hypothetical protein
MKARRFRAIIGSILLFCFLGAAFYVFCSSQIKSRRESSEIDNQKSVTRYIYRSIERKDTKLLKNLSFSFWDEVEIPGMPSSRFMDLETQKIFSSSQCPQGICMTEDFLLLTSYSEGNDDLGELFVFDRKSGSYLVTLGMNSRSHLGGVTYDGQNVWVCNSSSNTIERISYDFIELMAQQNRGQVVDASEMVDTFSVTNTPSCMTFYDDRIWIATYSTRKKNAVLVAYYYDQTKNELTVLNRYQIPKKVQGIEFDDEGRVYLSTSYGRSSSSYLKLYTSIFALSGDSEHPAVRVEMPPESEEIAFSDQTLYILFESAAEKYYYGTDGKGISISPIDKILMLDIDDVISSY